MKKDTIFPVTAHTDHVGPQSTFVCVPGTREDGVTFIPLAVQKGARTIVVEQSVVLPAPIQELIAQQNVVITRVDNARAALASLSAEAAGFPARKLRLIGVTGTKGKTTVTFLLKHLLEQRGRRVAMLSTVHNAIGQNIFEAPLTTAQPDYLHQFFKTCVEQQIEWVVVEAAAQAFSLHRLDTVLFDAAIYTNASPDHSEFYSTFEAYTAAKAQIVQHLKPHAPLIFNGDDSTTRSCAQACDSAVTVVPVHERDIAPYAYPESLLGRYNEFNAHMAIASLEALGFGPRADLLPFVQTFSTVPGRVEKLVLKNGARAYLDYAHNQASVRAVLGTLRMHTNDLIVVIGGSGDRGRSRRMQVATEAAALGDTVFITIDNPRSEEPDVIIQDMLTGIPAHTKACILINPDREAAIRAACTMAKPESIIAVLGKGPDEYILIKGVKYPFSEKGIISQFC